MKKVLIACLILCGIVALGPRSYAQTVTATLVGTVTDKTGAVVPRAAITVTETQTGIARNTVTNDSGNYTLPDLPPGAYSVTAEVQGFKRETRARVDVIVNTTTRQDFALTPGGTSETITVTDVVPLLQTDRADVSTKIEVEKLEDLPLAQNRNFQGLLNLVPGTTPATFQHSQFFNAASSLQTQVNGLPRTGNNYEIEGIDDNERSGLLQVMIPPADAIETVDVSTNNYEPELGRGFGGSTNVTLKSGTNKFHGSASEYLQNNFFNARSYFSSGVGHVAYNYFGGNISGPIFKEKLFFYFDYFRNSDHEATASTITIPYGPGSAPGAAKDWSAVCVGGVGFVDLSAGLNYNGNGRGQIYDPATGVQTGSASSGPGATGFGRTPFANNQIPCSRVSPVTLAFLKGLPKANQNVTSTNLAAPSNNYFSLLPFQKGQNTFDGKVDYQLTPKDRLAYRYEYQNTRTFQAPVFAPQFGGDSPGGGFAATGTQKAFSTALSFNHMFSPKLLAEFRFGVAHYRNDAQQSDYGQNDATKIGIPGANVNPFTSGQVTINLGSFSQPTFGYAASLPWIRAETNIDFVNHWTYIAGNHTVKAGLDLRRIRDGLVQGQTNSPRGLYSFGNSQTNIPGTDNSNFSNALGSFLLDTPSGAGRDNVSIFPELRQWYIFSFLSDKWQVTPKLTLDLGVRYEIYPPPTPRKAGGFSNYDFATNTLMVAGVGSVPMDLGLAKHFGDVGPRFGAAYRLKEGTVLRGGFGLSYSPIQDNTYAYNYPVKAANAYTVSAKQNGFASAVLDDQVTYATYNVGFPAANPIPVPSSGIIDVAASGLNSQSFIIIPHDFKNAYAEMFNVMIQQALPGSFSLQLGYVGNHGVHLGSNFDLNNPAVLGGGNSSKPQFAKYGRTSSATEYFNGVSSNYSSLQVLLTRRFTNGLSSSSAFTWGKALSYIGNGDEAAYYFAQDPKFSYGAPTWDRRLNYQQSFTYELPIGTGKRFLSHGFAARAIGGWKLASTVGITSGAPFTVGYSGTTLNTPGWNQTANLSGQFHKLGGGPGHLWFDPAPFRGPQPVGCTGVYAYPNCPNIKGVTVGNTKFDQFYGPGFVQNNASIFKTFGLLERLTMDVRMDVFQLTNTPQFSGLDTGINDANFGQITGTLGSGAGAVNSIGGGRSLQLAAIIKF